MSARKTEVIGGAESLFSPDNIFVIEATLLGFNPRFGKIIDWFYPRGFVVFDIIDSLYRPFDDALWQVDLVFIHQDNPIRRLGPFE